MLFGFSLSPIGFKKICVYLVFLIHCPPVHVLYGIVLEYPCAVFGY